MAFLRYWCHHLSKQNLATTNQIYFEKHGIICISYFGSTCNLCRYSTRHVSIFYINVFTPPPIIFETYSCIPRNYRFKQLCRHLNNNIVKKALKEYYNHTIIQFLVITYYHKDCLFAWSINLHC